MAGTATKPDPTQPPTARRDASSATPPPRRPGRPKKGHGGGTHGREAAAGWLFIVGTLIFSGSLYVLTLSGIRWLGAITPIGGAALLLGWGCLAWGIARAS